MSFSSAGSTDSCEPCQKIGKAEQECTFFGLFADFPEYFPPLFRIRPDPTDRCPLRVTRFLGVRFAPVLFSPLVFPLARVQVRHDKLASPSEQSTLSFIPLSNFFCLSALGLAMLSRVSIVSRGTAWFSFSSSLTFSLFLSF